MGTHNDEFILINAQSSSITPELGIFLRTEKLVTLHCPSPDWGSAPTKGAT